MDKKTIHYEIDELNKLLCYLKDSLEDLNNRMNLRTNSLRDDLEDLKATVDSLDEIIDRRY